MIAELGRALRSGETSSAGLVNRAFERIASSNPQLNLFIAVLEDYARRRAAELDSELAQGRDRGPFHGIPIAVKDLVNMRGVRTTAGSRVFENFVADEDASIVTRFEAAGAVIVGKTGLHELAYGITSNNPHFGTIRNPRDPDRIPGGSSGGSGGAVAAGIVPMGIGTDTGGSIRIPASFCGCAGLKPTYGRVSKHGVLPLGFTLDHIGPLAASVDDCAITLDALAGHDPLDPTSSRRAVVPYRPGVVDGLRGVRIGRPVNFYFDSLAPDVDAAVQKCFEIAQSLGAEIVSVRIPSIEEINAVARLILLAEAAAALEPHLSRRESFGSDVLALLDQGRLVPATAYVQAQRLRSNFIAEFRAVWAKVDCLFTAATPTTAPQIGATTVRVGDAEEDVRLATTRLARGINLLGVPALALPCGRDGAGLPVGLQIVAAPFEEQKLLRIGAALESALPPA